MSDLPGPVDPGLSGPLYIRLPKGVDPKHVQDQEGWLAWEGYLHKVRLLKVYTSWNRDRPSEPERMHIEMEFNPAPDVYPGGRLP